MKTIDLLSRPSCPIPSLESVKLADTFPNASDLYKYFLENNGSEKGGFLCAIWMFEQMASKDNVVEFEKILSNKFRTLLYNIAINTANTTDNFVKQNVSAYCLALAIDQLGYVSFEDKVSAKDGVKIYANSAEILLRAYKITGTELTEYFLSENKAICEILKKFENPFTPEENKTVDDTLRKLFGL